MLKYLGTIFFTVLLCTILYLVIYTPTEIHKSSHSKSISNSINNFDNLIKFVGLCWLFPGSGCHILTNNNELPVPDLFVKITGKQWKWQFEYRDKNSNPISLAKRAYANNTEKNQLLILPLGKNIHLSFSSMDVIHAWSVPQFALSADVIPGRIHTINLKPEKLGDFQGDCSELCGKGHDKMKFIVRIVPFNRFKKWQQNSN